MNIINGNKKAKAVQNEPAPKPIIFDDEKCDGCDICVKICPTDCLIHFEGEKTPEVFYPDECWHCGVCESNCPKGAITFIHPMSERVRWKRKGTDEHFRIRSNRLGRNE